MPLETEVKALVKRVRAVEKEKAKVTVKVKEKRVSVMRCVTRALANSEVNAVSVTTLKTQDALLQELSRRLQSEPSRTSSLQAPKLRPKQKLRPEVLVKVKAKIMTRKRFFASLSRTQPKDHAPRAKTAHTTIRKSSSIPPVNTSVKVKEKERRAVVRQKKAQEKKLVGIRQLDSAAHILRLLFAAD